MTKLPFKKVVFIHTSIHMCILTRRPMKKSTTPTIFTQRTTGINAKLKSSINSLTTRTTVACMKNCYGIKHFTQHETCKKYVDFIHIFPGQRNTDKRITHHYLSITYLTLILWLVVHCFHTLSRLRASRVILHYESQHNLDLWHCIGYPIGAANPL